MSSCSRAVHGIDPAPVKRDVNGDQLFVFPFIQVDVFSEGDGFHMSWTVRK